MRPRQVFWSLLGLVLVLEAALFGWVAWLAPADLGPAAHRSLFLFMLGAAGLLSGGVLIGIWAFLDLTVFRPAMLLSRGVESAAEADGERHAELPRLHLLGQLPEHLDRLAEAYWRAHTEARRSRITGEAGVEEQRRRLETVLREVVEGVVVCDGRGEVLLHNQGARRLIGAEALAVGRSLFAICSPEPLRHALAMLRRRAAEPPSTETVDQDVRFACATASGDNLLGCRMSLLSTEKPESSGFVLAFEDVTPRFKALRSRDRLLGEGLERMRGPLANLRAAVENLTAFQDMDALLRRRFEAVVATECEVLSQRFSALLHQRKELGSGAWMLADLHAKDLADTLVRRLEGGGGPRLRFGEASVWLHGDSHGLLSLLDYLVRAISHSNSAAELGLEFSTTGKRVYLDIVWEGKPIPQAEIETWFQQRLSDADGGLTVHEILERHGGNLWSQRHARPGYALLRVPLPASDRPWANDDGLPTRRGQSAHPLAP